MAKKDHPNRLATLAARIGSPQVVSEIDKALSEMRQEWLDLVDLRKSAVRRHGDRGLPIPMPSMEDIGGLQVREPSRSKSDLTVAKLFDIYKSNPTSAYQKIGFKSRVHYDALMSTILKDRSDCPLGEINARVLNEWHSAWSDGGKVAVAHSKIGMLRRLFGFGASVLEDAECTRLATVLHTMRFKMPKRRTERLTAAQAIAIRMKAHERSRPSLALAQAFQFDLGLTQKSVIGDWVPESEPGQSDVVWKGFKWISGVRWSDIDDNMVLKISTPGQEEPLVVNLRQSPMVMEEFKLIFAFDGNRSSLPAAGPIVASEHSKRPWEAPEFRRWWRTLADACEIPSTVRNMDSRPKIGRRRTQEYDEDEELEAFADGSDDELLSMH